MTDLSAQIRATGLAATALAVVTLTGCSDNGDFDVTQQIGPDPVLPEPSTRLLPDLKVAEVIGWQDGETPTVPDGLAISAYATDLAHPRTVHTLPNGDVLVVQGRGPSGKPLNRPKDIFAAGSCRSPKVAAGASRRKAISSRCCATPTATAPWMSAATC